MYEKLNKKARSLMLVSELIVCSITTIILVIIWNLIKNVNLPVSPNWIFLIVAVVWLLGILAPFVRYERYRYRFTDEEIDVKEGFLFVERNIVPIERLHKVSMMSGPLDRLFGLSKVIVTTAGGDVTIRFLELGLAEQIVDTLKGRINSYAVQSRKEEAQKRAELMQAADTLAAMNKTVSE